MRGTAAAATIATLAVPSLYEQSILFRFAVIVLAGCFGVPGLACAALTILAMACGSEPFGYDYLYPLMGPGQRAGRLCAQHLEPPCQIRGGDQPP